MPKLSVVMSVYIPDIEYGEGVVRYNYLDYAISSVLCQTFKDFEFIIVNDGSGREASRILRKFAERDGRIEILEGPNNGLTLSLIHGIGISHGDYVARQDADDCSAPDRFEEQIAILNSMPDVNVVGCPIGDGNEDIAKGNIFIHGSLMFRKGAYMEAGGYSPSFPYSQDYDLLLRMLKKGRHVFADRSLYKLRKHKFSVSNEHGMEQRKCKEMAQALCRIRGGRHKVPAIQKARNLLRDIVKGFLPYTWGMFNLVSCILICAYIKYVGIGAKWGCGLYNYAHNNLADGMPSVGGESAVGYRLIINSVSVAAVALMASLIYLMI